MADGWDQFQAAPKDSWEQFAPAKAAAAAPVQAAPPKPSFMENLRNAVGGVRQSLYDIPQSVIELGARGTDALGISNGAYPVVHQSFQEDRKYLGNPESPAFKGGELVGNVATTIPAGGIRVGGALAAKAPTIAKIVSGAGQGLAASAATSAASNAPLGQQLALGAAGGAALPVAGSVLRGAKNLAVGALGESTGAGASSIRNAYQAGVAGGDKSKAFTSAMRDPSTWDNVVASAKQAVSNLKQQRGNAYRNGMQDISADRTVLDFKPVDDAMAKNSSVKNFHGKDLEPDTADVRQKVAATIDDWRNSDPATFHTPEGFDALKQKLGGFRDSEKYGSPAWKVANDAYNAVRNTIAEQAPVYDKVMGDYSKASSAINELEKELSLGPKGNPNTALRKLQSVMRDNANTSWGKRSQLAGNLQDAGATTLMPSLAGQALSSPIPRGLAKYGDLALAVGGGLTNPATLAALPFASPRIVGEGAHLAGRAVGGAGDILKKVPFQVPAFPPVLSPAFGATAPLLFAPQR